MRSLTLAGSAVVVVGVVIVVAAVVMDDVALASSASMTAMLLVDPSGLGSISSLAVLVRCTGSDALAPMGADESPLSLVVVTFAWLGAGDVGLVTVKLAPTASSPIRRIELANTSEGQTTTSADFAVVLSARADVTTCDSSMFGSVASPTKCGESSLLACA